MKEIDETSWEIMHYLQADARLTYAEIGKRIGLTAPAIAERIRKLEAQGIISGYHAHINYDALGLSLMGIVNINNTYTNSSKIKEIAQELPEVISCDILTGDRSHMMRIVARTRAHLLQVLENFLEYGQTSTQIVLEQPIAFKPLSADVVNQKK